MRDLPEVPPPPPLPFQPVLVLAQPQQCYNYTRANRTDSLWAVSVGTRALEEKRGSETKKENMPKTRTM